MYLITLTLSYHLIRVFDATICYNYSYMTSHSNPEPTKLSKSGLYDSEVRTKKKCEGETRNKPLSHPVTVTPLRPRTRKEQLAFFLHYIHIVKGVEISFSVMAAMATS